MPTIGVAIAIIDADKVLLTRRRDVRFWCLPGGGIDQGETVAQAARREALEETGLEIELQRLVGVYSRPNWWNGGAHEILLSGYPVGGRLVQETDETVDARYFAVEEIPEDLLFWHRRRIEDAFLGRSAVLRLQDVGKLLGISNRQEAYELIGNGTIPRERFEEFLRGESSERFIEELELGEDDAAV